MYLLAWLLFLLAFQTSVLGQQTHTAKATEAVPVPKDSSGTQFLIGMSYSYLYKTGEDSLELSIAYTYASQAMELSQKLGKPVSIGDVHLLMSRIRREQRLLQKSKWHLVQAFDIYKLHNKQAKMGDVLMERRRHYGLNGKELDSRIKLVEESIKLYQVGLDRFEEAGAYRELGDLLQIRGDYRRALDELKRSLGIYNQIGYKETQGVYDLLGSVNTLLSMPGEGLKYGLMAVKTAQLMGDSTMQLCTIYNRLGNTYQSIGQDTKAYECFQKSIEIAIRHKDNEAIFIVAAKISGLLRGKNLGNPRRARDYLLEIIRKYPALSAESRVHLLGGLVLAYDQLGGAGQADFYCRQILAISRKVPLPEAEERMVYGVASEHYLAGRDYKNARVNIAAHRRLALKNGGTIHLGYNHLLSFKLDSALQHFPSAIRHYQTYKVIMDSVFSTQKQREMSLLNIRFDIERKDQELNLRAQNIDLLTKRANLQQALLDKTRLNRNITVAILILSVVLLALLYSRYRARQKNTRVIEQNNAQLKKMVDEKSWLIREIHHRVKNNLQIVISLLNIQSSNLQNEAAVKAIRESQARMYAMSLIHQKLYMNSQRASINMQRYIQELSAYLKESFDLGNRIALELDVDIIELDVSQAVPIGLILNEAITNSIKYGFPSNGAGKIRISLYHTPDQLVELVIRDNGVGLPADMDWQNSLSTGFSLISTLADQIDASLNVQSDEGVVIALKFTPQPVGDMQA